MTTISSPTAGGGVPPSFSAPVTNSRGVNISSRIAAAKPPRITIQIPPHGASALPHPFVMSRNNGGVTTAGSTPMPPSVSTAGSPSAYANPFGSAYQATTAGFMFKQFEGLKDFTFASAKSGLNIGEKSAFYIYEKFSKWSRKWFTHCFLFLVILLYSVAGAFMFVALEGPRQQQGIFHVRELRHEFSAKLHVLAQNPRLTTSLAEWQGAVDRELQPFMDNLTVAIKAGHFDGDQKIKPPTWTFWNAMFYCGTIYTTIGYGHIYPATTAGRALTIVYAIIGIPMFLILLADFGKWFTRGIKVLWRYVRRLYYTGSLRRVRKQAHVQEVLRGMNIAYEVATFRRPSMMMREAPELAAVAAAAQDAEVGGTAETPVTPETPAPTDIDINDEEFNLPISLAIFMLIAYILCGAIVYSLWEDWTFFEASYFVFVSMSTIGFGDYVPKHPMFMMASIVYLVFGMALTSMCINVVQVKLSDSFRQASAKISASIGMVMAEAEAEAQAEEERRSLAVTPAPAEGGAGDWPLVHRPAGLLNVPQANESEDGANETSEAAPALPPKKVTLVNETMVQQRPNAELAAAAAAEEVKKRRRFWK